MKTDEDRSPLTISTRYPFSLWRNILPFSLGVLLLILIFPFDLQIRSVIQTLRTSWGTQIMEMFTLIGNGFIIVGICALFLGFGHFLKRSTLWKSGLFGLITYAVSGILVQVVKHLVGRPRPRFLESNIHHWGPSLTSGFDSFPSGHTTSAFALALLLSHFYPGGKILFFGGAALVSFSRLYVDAHFASDLLGGALLGSGTSLILISYISRPKSLALQEGGNTRSEAHAPYHDP